jgi:hypothetical protein
LKAKKNDIPAFSNQRSRPDATDGYEWYERKQHGLGKKFFDELDQCFLQILKSPQRFPQDQNQHIALVNKFPYRVVFEVDSERITVFAVYHDKRYPKKLTERKNHDEI